MYFLSSTIDHCDGTPITVQEGVFALPQTAPEPLKEKIADFISDYVLIIGENSEDDHGDFDYRSDSHVFYHSLDVDNCVMDDDVLVGYIYKSCFVYMQPSFQTIESSYERKSRYHTLSSSTTAKICKLEDDGCFYGVDGIHDSLVFCKRNMTGCCRPQKPFQTIGYFAFQNCTLLESIVLPEGVWHIEGTCFSGCRNLKSINIPRSVGYVGRQPFRGCCSLEDVTIDPRAKINVWEMFEDTPFLEKINCLEDGYYVENFLITYSKTKTGRAEIREGTKVIAAHAFDGCQISEVVLPSSVEEIGNDAFAHSDITHIVLSKTDAPLKMGRSVFSLCEKLTSVKIEARLETLPTDTFWCCDSLKHVELPSTLVAMEKECFYNCSALEELRIPNGTTTIDDAFSQCTALRAVHIPPSVTSIGTYRNMYGALRSTFSDCPELTIYCAEGSYAEQHAKEYGVKYILEN